MKKNLLRVMATMLLLSLIVVSCNQDDQNVKPSSKDEGLSEILKLEKEEGIVFFKKEVEFESAGSKAVLLIATRSEVIFKNVVENYDFVITPISKNDLKSDNGNSAATSGLNGNQEQIFTGEEIMTEFITSERKNGELGFAVTMRLKTSANGRVAHLSNYDYYSSHTSSNWPSTFWLDLPGSGAGLSMDAKWKWYNGWSSNTIYSLGSSCGGVSAGTAGHSWDLFGTCNYDWNVDGPYRCRATIGRYLNSDGTGNGETWGFTY